MPVHLNGSSNLDADYTTTLYGKWQKDTKLALALFGELKKLMPAAIIETVFITNPYEAALLFSGTGRHQQIAERLEVGIVNFIGPP